MKIPFKITWEEVTPAKAVAWLTKNTRNRNLRETTVQSFASDMSRGAWSPSHQGIAFAADGRLLDGQHRLAAIAKSGVSIWFAVFRDVPDRIEGIETDVMDAIDRGNARSVADVLKLSHGYKVNAIMVTAACWTIGALSVRNPLSRVRKLSVSVAISIAERYKAGLEFVSGNRSRTVGLRSAQICGAVAFSYAVAPKKTEELYHQFSTGAGLDHESPILVLRNAILEQEAIARAERRSRIELARGVLHAFYCAINRKEMPRLPKPGALPGADWFIQQQPDNVRFLETLFPAFEPKPQPTRILAAPDFLEPRAKKNSATTR